MSNPIKLYPNLLSNEDCDKAVKYISARKYAGTIKKGTSNRWHLTNNDNEMSNYLVNHYGSLALQKYLGSIPNNIWVTDHLFAIYPSNAFMVLHSDKNTDFGKVGNYDLHTFVFYLNDNYEGGNITFPDYNLSIKPSKGLAIMFPGNLLHKVEPVISGTRYIFGGGFTNNPDVHLFDFPIPSKN
jgi:predicted 2-oxoglutarate/Fe(II)-dependent dioxygenase YbiX